MKGSIYAMIFTLLTFVPLASSQTIVKEGPFDSEAIKLELVAKYEIFNGRLENQTVAMWDTYFLRSPNIGNMHEGHPEIGWETVHKGSIGFVKSKPTGEMIIADIECYPINSNTAWVRGKMVVRSGNQVLEAGFYDSLVKTVEGWRVILSMVSPEHRKEEDS